MNGALRGIARVGRVVGAASLAGIGLGAGALAWGQVERRTPTIRRYDIQLPADRQIPDVTLLQIADLHLFPGQEFLIDFLDEVARTEHFDAVIATGDNFGDEHGIDLVTRAYEPFLTYPGAFVFGSNDYYSPHRKNWGSYLFGASKIKERTVPDLPWTELATFLRDAGWADLTNRADVIRVPAEGGDLEVGLLGADDAHINRDRIVEPSSSWDQPTTLRLGVTHSPYLRVVNALTRAGSDLILAGHTHGGQIGLPFYGAIITNCDIDRQYAKGLHHWSVDDSQAWLHVSAGLGTSPFAPVRIATRPEVSLITVRSA
ncbi:metallophosphoesterase [Schaalia vaccimaxillae]|uniref:metallophosphoesterase n=1 Tax=Schaalia vaccimaxillae TaxID=183916 RepID=UPI0003B763BB|nr:metallophosphoesterase [Schaalia vaccimaxillae]